MKIKIKRKDITGMNRQALAQSGSVESETGKSVAVPAKDGAYEEHPTWKSVRGRMSRREYLFFNFIIFPIIGFGASFVARGIGWLFIIVLVFARIAASVRRFHDFGSSGLWLSVFYIGKVACFFLATKGNWTLDGVGAAFDYLAGNISRAPEWMQKHNLEWFYRLMQDPKRLFYRYFHTNTSFIWNAVIRGK